MEGSCSLDGGHVQPNVFEEALRFLQESQCETTRISLLDVSIRKDSRWIEEPAE